MALGTRFALYSSMKTSFMKPLFAPLSLALGLTLTLSASFATAKNRTLDFELKPLPTAQSSEDQIRQGLMQLYRGDIDDTRLTQTISKAEEFQSFIYDSIENQIQTNKFIHAETSERYLTGRFVKETTVRFPSLIQREGDHPANTVVARIYEPTGRPSGCDYQYPTSIFLHHILNQVPQIETAAKVMSAGVLNQSAIMVVLHMPHYGERRLEGDEFLTNDLGTFKRNVAQLVLDVHVLRNLLETRDKVNPNKISLTGISLGSVMGITVGAFDQGFESYGNLVGGGDMANILFNRASTRPDSEVAVALQGLDLDENSMRDELAAIDPITWSHRYQNKSVFMLSASRDDIISYEDSVTPLLGILQENGNQVKHRVNDDTHSPSGSALDKFRNSFRPLMKFIVDGSPSMNRVCRP